MLFLHFLKEISQTTINSVELNSPIPTEPVVSSAISSPIETPRNSGKKKKIVPKMK